MVTEDHTTKSKSLKKQTIMLKELQAIKFDHHCEDFTDAIGVSSETDEYCREIVYFTAFSNQLLGKELFPDEKDRPRVLTTITGDLEKSLGFVQTEEQAFYLLLIFRKAHEIAIQAFGQYEQINDANELEKRKMRVSIEQVEITMEEQRKKHGDMFISPLKVINKIEYVKESRYNFQKYLEIIERESNNSFYEDVRKAFGG